MPPVWVDDEDRLRAGRVLDVAPLPAAAGRRGRGPGASDDGSVEAGGEPPGAAQAARTRSMTKRPGDGSFHGALTPAPPRRFPPNSGRQWTRCVDCVRPRRRSCSSWPCRPAAALAHGADAPSPELPGVFLRGASIRWSLGGLRRGGGVPVGGATRDRGPPGQPAAAPTDRGCSAPAWWPSALALLSPIEAYEGALFSVHMVQHMLLELVAAPLLLAGGADHAGPARGDALASRRRLLAVLQSRLVQVALVPGHRLGPVRGRQLGLALQHLYDQALENQALHYFQHATFLGAALLFWWPAIGADPSPWRLPHPVRLLYLFLAMPQNSFLGVALLSASTVLYPHYVTNVRDWGLTPAGGPAAGRGDHVGGRRRRLPGGHGAWSWLWMRHEERRTDRLDAGWRRNGRREARSHGGRSAPAVDASGQRAPADQRVGGDRGEQQGQVADREPEEVDRGAPVRRVGPKAERARAGRAPPSTTAATR